MAERKSFMLYLDTSKQWDMLTNEQAGILIKALFLYTQTGEQLCSEDGMLMMAFSFIAGQIDRDNDKYEQKCNRNKQIAIEREEKKRAERERKNTEVHEREQQCTNSTDTDTETDTETDTDTERETDTDTDAADKPRSHTRRIKYQKPAVVNPPTVDEVRAYCQERGNGIDAQRFVEYHASVGWMQNGSPITDWRAAVRKWETTQARDKPKPDGQHGGYSSINMADIKQLIRGEI